MRELTTDFPYLGDRDYIHGTSVVSAIIGELAAPGAGPLLLQRVKFQKRSLGNGRLVFFPGDLPPEFQDANCVFSARSGETRWRGAFLDQGLLVRERVRVAYAVEEFRVTDGRCRCRIAPAGLADLVRLLVEANKRFHQAWLAGEGQVREVRFGFLENWSPPAGAAAACAATLEISNLIRQKTPAGFRTINRLSYGEEGAQHDLTLCFDVSIDTP